MQISQLLQNLIANDIKFRAKQDPIMTIKTEQKAGKCYISVADNGIGIQPQHTEKVFEIFQRLHGRSKYPGTGIGLAVCKKIVERHGGEIWLEFKPGYGTTFYFTLQSS